MWLFIESVHGERFRLGFLAAGRTRVKKYAGRSNRILVELAKIASPAKLAESAGICVVSGPGSFTSVRTGTLIANLLSRLFRKPLVAIPPDDALDLHRLVSRLEAGVLRPIKYAAPEYFAEPNITLKK